MTGPLGPRPGFDPDELRDGDGPAPTDGELAQAWATAREIRGALAADGGLPASGRAGAGLADPAFVDRVMTAIEREPAPRPAAAGAVAARHGRLRGVVASLGDAWRVAFGSGRRSLVARVGALAYVLVAFVVIGSAGTIAVVGTAAFLAPDGSTPPSPMASQPVTGPGPSGAPGASLAPGSTRAPGSSAAPGGSAAPAASGDDGGRQASDSPRPSGSPSASPAAGQTASPSPSQSPGASASPDASRTPRPTTSPTASPTASPTGTPKPTSSSGGGSGGSGPGT